MLLIFLLLSLFLVHEELHGWISEFAIEQNAKEILSVSEWIFRFLINTLEYVDEQLV